MRRLLLLLLFTSGITLLRAQTATMPSGSGTGSDPYRIATVDNLYWLSQNSNYWGSYYKQTANIDASGISNFTPIGNGTTYFTGTYNGNGYAISGLTISRSSTSLVGMFGKTNNATISDLGLTGASVSGYHYTGILAGTCNGSTIVSQCFATGTVSSTGSSVGGLIGELGSGGTVTNCYAIATVSSTNSSCNIGGLIGFNYGTVSYCYASATATASGGSIGGLLGNSGTVATSSYYNSEICSSGSSFATPKTATELKTQSTFYGWDFSSPWGISSSSNGGYPFLLPVIPSVGDGSSTNPYQIATLNNLRWLSENSSVWSSHFIQTADINASATSTWNRGAGFSPIGNSTIYFNGNYNGNGHTISGLFISQTSSSNIGLFGYIDCGTVNGIRMIGSSITGNAYVGGIAGYCSGTVVNCGNTGTIVATGEGYAGGIVGSAGLGEGATGIPGSVHGNVDNCYNNGTVKGTSSSASTIGGIAGENLGMIKNCYNTGSVSGSSLAGEIVGRNGIVFLSWATVSYCYYNNGTIGNNNYGTISNCSYYSDSDIKSSDFVSLLNTNRDNYSIWVVTDSYPTFGLNIYYFLNGGTNNTSNPDSYTSGVGATLSNPTKTGYTFGGWYDNANFTGTAITAISTTATGDVTLYAKWEVNTYTITYNLNGGTNDAANTSTYTYGVGLTLSNPTQTGYAFGGWYDNASFTGTAITAVSTTTTGDVTFYAKWTANTYNITYSLNGGTNDAANTATYTYGIGLILSNPTQTGYTFGGWYDNTGFTGTAITAISSTVTGDVTLYAKWTKVYNFTASAGAGGSISPLGDVSVEEGTDQTFIITANTGYVVSDVLVDGASVGAVSSYTFSNVTADHTITVSFESTTGIDKTDQETVVAYPNPCTSGFTINAGEETNTIFIYNITGSLVHIQQISGSTYVSMESLNAGTYILKVKGKVLKIIKE
jgi:uncharacterized repeat protein (TIGR02543 family)